MALMSGDIDFPQLNVHRVCFGVSYFLYFTLQLLSLPTRVWEQELREHTLILLLRILTVKPYAAVRVTQ
jgi:hypothetical protein